MSARECPRVLRCCAPPKTKKQANRMLGCGICGLLFGLALIILASTVPAIVINIVDDGLADSLIIDDDQSSGHEGFTSNRKSPTIMEVMLLDIMNPAEILEGASPVLMERGPFVYHAMKERYNLSWSEDGEVLTWREHEYFLFDEAASAESDTDRQITSIYMPFAALRATLAGARATQMTRNQLTAFVEFYVPLSERDRYFNQKTARELLFGYPDRLMAIANMVDPTVDPVFPGFMFNGTSREATEKRKGTSNLYSFWTGKNHHDRIRHWITWKNMTHIQACPQAPCPPKPTSDAWATHDAGAIIGCDGSAFAPDVTQDRKLDVWFGSFYRSVAMEFKKKVTFRGVDLLRFGLPSNIANNASLTPTNSLYYQDGPSGFYNVTAMVNSLPVFISNAQFKDIPLSSMAPRVEVVWKPRDSDFYDTFFDVEPISGAGFHASSSSQLNIQIGPLKGMPTIENETADATWFQSMPTLYMPLFWARQEAGIPQADADEFTSKVYGALFMSDVALYLGAIGGTLLLIMGVAFTGMALRAKRELKQFGEHAALMKSEANHQANGHSPRKGNGNGDNNGNHADDNDIGGVVDGMAHRDVHDNDDVPSRPAAASVDISYQV